jgi:O-antigen/teichoic acid export membrane protein
LLASSKYLAAQRLLPLLITGLMVYGIHLFFNAGLFIHQRTGMTAALVIFSCAVKLVLNWLLIPRMGLEAAAITAIISYTVFVAVMAYWSARYLPVRLPFTALSKAALGGAAVLPLARLNLGSAFWNCAARGVTGLCVYGVLICVLDREIGRMAVNLLGFAGRKNHTLSAASSTVRADDRV